MDDFQKTPFTRGKFTFFRRITAVRWVGWRGKMTVERPLHGRLEDENVIGNRPVHVRLTASRELLSCKEEVAVGKEIFL